MLYHCYTISIIIAISIYSSTLYAKSDRYPFVSSQQQQTFVNLTKQLRCTVCQNQTIYDSMAPLAEDMRSHIYNMLQNGNTEQQILAFMTYRYGDFILYRPPFIIKTWLLWVGPVLMLVIGLVVWYRTCN